MTTEHTRRQFFAVTSSLQYRFLAMALIYSFIIVCFFAMASFGPDMIEMRDKSLSLEIRSTAANRVLIKHSWVWLAGLSLILVLGIHSFLTFQKVAGPLYRFRWALKQLEKGNMHIRVKTRKRDYLRAEEVAFNKMIEALVGKLENVRHETDEVSRSMDKLEQHGQNDNGWSKAQKVLLDEHRGQLESLESAVQWFRIEDESQE